KKKASPVEQLKKWAMAEIEGETTRTAIISKAAEYIAFIEADLIPGFTISNGELFIDIEEGLGFDKDFVGDGAILFHLSKPMKKAEPAAPVKAKENFEPAAPIVITQYQSKAKKGKKKVSEDQFAFDLFG